MKRKRKHSRNTEAQTEAQKCGQQKDFTTSKGGKKNKPKTKNTWAQLRAKVSKAETGKVGNGQVRITLLN